MKVIEYNRCGGPEVLECATRPDPECGAGEVLIAVEATSVNPVDAKIRSGGFPGLPCSFPAGTGRDGAGVVQEVGEGVDPGLVGQLVCYLAQRGVATWSTMLVLPADQVEPVPDGLGPVEAASLPLAGVSAWAGLVEAGALGPGESVLVHAAAGGVGSLAVQIARARGATVWASCSSGNADYVAGLGADHVIRRDTLAFDEAGKTFDLVFDLIGGKIRERSRNVVRPGGRLVGLNALPFTNANYRDDIRECMAEVQPGTGALRALLDLVASGDVAAQVSQVLPFSDFVTAHSLIETGRTRGKIVLDLRG
ncbi:MAG: NADP-dependent oxidoreductase [Pararhodobacter sp.]|nr:NADP-dependent oxidoreductase [Pararhodobacter sp.]